MTPHFLVRRVVHALLVGILLLVAYPTWVEACEIEVKIKGTQKELYEKGEIVILKVSVFLTHRNCPEGIRSTKFNATGMKILGATRWKETSPGRFVRLIKVQIVPAQKGEGAFHVRRTCDREGGYGVLKLRVPASATDPTDAAGATRATDNGADEADAESSQ